jgi:N6-L-threonylcarbamoyladenine synthase
MIIGIDTSCYTTSIAMINENNGDIVYDWRRLLAVELGQRGLRQSEAVFQHLQNLPKLFDEAKSLGFKGINRVTAVAGSIAPRPMVDSYLPVFKAGASFGETFAKLLGVPFIPTTHQEGHIRAGLYGQEFLNQQAFLAWHISGGTTELLRVQPQESGFAIEKIGGASDLQVGQFVDRVGVALGEAFPAGPYLEKLALLSNSQDHLPVVTQGLTISFSGPDSAAKRLIASGINGCDIARMVFDCIAKSLLKVSAQAIKDQQINRILLVGGVASSQIIRESLNAMGPELGMEFHFGAKDLSSDNAVGVGLIGQDYWQHSLGPF